jgi:hypothetical protein
MSDQNSAVERQIRPDEAMELLGIKKDAYYDRLKFLGIKTAKDQDGKAYLLPEQFEALEKLGSWISETGKMEGFVNSGSTLATAQDGGLLDAERPIEPESDPYADQMDELIRAAAEMKAHQIVLPDMVIRELAGRMSFEDLPQDLKDKVTTYRASSRPNFQPATIANNLLDQWRKKQTQAVA